MVVYLKMFVYIDYRAGPIKIKSAIPALET